MYNYYKNICRQFLLISLTSTLLVNLQTVSAAEFSSSVSLRTNYHVPNFQVLVFDEPVFQAQATFKFDSNIYISSWGSLAVNGEEAGS
jgi:hypothetical protein